MRYAIPTLFIILALIVLQTLFNNIQQASPAKETVSFLSDIQSGNLSKIVRHFGTNVCHCPKKKGWGAYLAYQTDEEPNLAFLVGHPFTIGQTKTEKTASPPQASHGVIWESPEDYIVNAQITFDRNKYSPFFLPLAMAYGKPMTWQEVKDFIEHPKSEYWKSFSLRLRSGLAENAINFDTSTIEPDVRGEFKFNTVQKNDNKDISWYLTPKDAGPVDLANGGKVSMEKLEQILPRLCSVIMQLRIVRSSQWQPYTVSEFDLIKPVLYQHDGNGLINLTDPH